MNLTPSDVADSTGALMGLKALKQRWPWVKHLFGDAAYDRRTLMDKAAFLDFTVEVVRGLQGQNGFIVQPRRVGGGVYLCLAAALAALGSRL